MIVNDRLKAVLEACTLRYVPPSMTTIEALVEAKEIRLKQKQYDDLCKKRTDWLDAVIPFLHLNGQSPQRKLSAGTAQYYIEILERLK